LRNQSVDTLSKITPDKIYIMDINEISNGSIDVNIKDEKKTKED
jgi:hypothetical protein